MQVSFHLRKDKLTKEGKCPVRMLISIEGVKVFKVISGVSVKSNQWDLKKERIKAPRKTEEYNFYIEHNKKIDYYEIKIKELFRYILLNEIPVSKDYINAQIKSDFKRIVIKCEFFSCYEEFIEVHSSTRALNTLKSYRTALNFVKDFQESKGFQVRFDSLGINFFEEFRNYAFEDREVLNNYFAKLIATLKTFMRWASDKGYHESIDYLKFKASEQEIEVVYLTMDELMKLYNHEFKSHKLEKVRDVYCFGAFTGLRYSDLKNLKASNIFENHISMTIKKTQTVSHKVPLNNFSKSILEKYIDTIFEPIPQISDVKFNKYIKECCAKAQINDPVTITRYIGQKRMDKTVPKYELVTSHTARKTFVTNSLVLGMKEMVVRNITGHKKETSFKRYVKIAEDLKQSEMDNTWNKL